MSIPSNPAGPFTFTYQGTVSASVTFAIPTPPCSGTWTAATWVASGTVNHLKNPDTLIVNIAGNQTDGAVPADIAASEPWLAAFGASTGQLTAINAAWGTNLSATISGECPDSSDNYTVSVTLTFTGSSVAATTTTTGEAENGDLQSVWPGAVGANELVFLRVTYPCGYLPSSRIPGLPESWTFAEVRPWGGGTGNLSAAGILTLLDLNGNEYSKWDQTVGGCDLFILGK